MSDGYQKQRLTSYLSGAREGAIGSAGADWKSKGALLQAVSEALQKKGPELAEKLGKDSKTAAELKTSLLSAATSMTETGGKLAAGGAALVVVGDNLEKARVQRTAMKSLIEPPPYTAPSYDGAQPTPEQIEKAATARAASNQDHSTYQTASSGQEADAAEITTKLDQAFLSAIPPMMAIHGGPDPTAPTPGPGGPGGPGSSTPPPIRNPRDREHGELRRVPELERDRDEQRDREQREREEREREQRKRDDQKPVDGPKDPVHVPTTNVQGGTDSGTSYQGVDAGGPSSHGSTGSTSAAVGGGAAAGAAGAGLGAGMMKGGSISGSAKAPSSGSVRGIGAGGRPGAPGSLTRGTSAAGSTARGASAGARASAKGATRAAGAGSASRSAGAGGRAGSTGAAGKGSAAKGGVRGSTGKGGDGRTRAAGSTSGKGSAKGKGLFRRGSNGSTSGGRSNKKDDERNTERDALVYEQDWLGEDTTAPSVLD